MASENLAGDERANTRIVFGRALAALVAAQANWTVISEVHGAERQAIENWAAKAKVDLNRPNAKARAKLLDVGNTALMSVALGSPHAKSSEDRLGTLGLLSPSLYEIKVQNPLSSELSERSLTKGDITQTLRYADAHQHFSPPPNFDPSSPLISIFVRVLNRDELSQGIASPDWCLVTASRKGRNLIAHDAYRIQRAMIVDPGTTPLDLFKAFCDVFGCELKVGEKRIGKFLLYDRVQGTGKIEAQSPPNHKVQVSAMAKSNDGIIELAFGYAIDLTVYRRVLLDQFRAA